MDAGVPILAPVFGISAGLVTQPSEGGGFEKHVVLTDILGAEDHLVTWTSRLPVLAKALRDSSWT